MSAQGCQRFKVEIGRWWPQLAFMATLIFALGAFQADASSTAKDYARRIERLEIAAPTITADLATLKTQAAATGKAVDRIENKLDRMAEGR